MKLKPLLTLAFDLLLRAESPEAPKRLPVLIVDDQKMAADLIEEHVTWCGAEAKIATSIEEARGYLKAMKFSRIFLDVGMPGEITGLEFKKEIKANKHWRHMRVIFVSAKPDLFQEVQKESLVLAIIKGMGNGSLREAIEEELALDKIVSAERSRAVFLVTQSYFWLAVLFGFGLHAGWWVNLIKLAFKHFTDK